MRNQFIKLNVYDREGNVSERYFNVRFIKTIDIKAKSVLLYDNIKPFVVTDESVRTLQELVSFARNNKKLW